MTKIGSIIKLYITEENSSNRLEQKSLIIDNGGIIGDKFFKKKEKREILLTSTKSYDYATSINMPIKESDLGENILVDFDIKTLLVGDQLQIGETFIEISMECPICNHLSHIDKTFPKLIKDHRGIFAKVLKGGIINNTDIVYKI